ncbi:MAG: porin family protein [Bacteroidota bacterium]
MKKLVLSVMILIAAASVSQAQGLRLGIKAGGNLNKVEGQSFSDGFDFSYHAGGFLEIDFNKKWGIQPEVLFSQTTTKPSSFKTVYTTASNPSLVGDDKIKLNYLSIPLLLRYNVGGILSLNAGPQFSILLSEDKTLLQNGQSAFKNGDLALVLGGQINLSVLRIYGRYNIGLQNINDIDSKDKWTSQQIQLGLGLRF